MVFRVRGPYPRCGMGRHSRRLELARGLLALAVVVGGAGCSDSASTAIRAEPTSVAFVVQAGTSQSQVVTITFRGDGVVAGYAPGVPQASWLTVTTAPVTQTPTTATFTLTAAAPTVVSAVKETTSVRFVTGRLPADGNAANATGLVYTDVAVSMTTINFQASPLSLALNGVAGSLAEPTPADARGFTLSSSIPSVLPGSPAGPSVAWTATSDQPWLTLVQSSGVTPSTLSFRVSAAGLGAGTHVANVSVHDTTDDLTLSLPVTLTLTSPVLTVTPSVLDFSVDAATTPEQLALPLVISDETNGAAALSWRLDSVDVPWIANVTPASGSSAAPGAGPVTVGLSAHELESVPNGDHTGTIAFDYVGPGGQAALARVTVRLHLHLPRVSWVAPYVVSVGDRYELIVRGDGLSGIAGQPLMFGTAPVSGATVIGDGELRVGSPDLPAGEVPVGIPNRLGIAAGSARLLIKAAGPLPAGAIAISGDKARIFYDDERGVLYGVDTAASRVDRLALQQGAWAVLPPITVPKLQDAALSPDGVTMVMVTLGAGIYELNLTGAGAAPMLAVATDTLFSSIAFSNHDVAVLTTTLMGSGQTPLYTYNTTYGRAVTTPVAGSGFGLFIARAFASGDGRRILLTQTGLSPPPALVGFDSSTDQTFQTPIMRNISQATINRDGSRFVVDGDAVYDGAFNQLGHLSGELRVAISPDGNRAYGYTFDPQSGAPVGVAVHDLSEAPDGAGAFPVVAVLPLPGLSAAGDLAPPALTLSRDGLTLFVWGSASVQILPLR